MLAFLSFLFIFFSSDSIALAHRYPARSTSHRPNHQSIYDYPTNRSFDEKGSKIEAYGNLFKRSFSNSKKYKHRLLINYIIKIGSDKNIKKKDKISESLSSVSSDDWFPSYSGIVSPTDGNQSSPHLQELNDSIFELISNSSNQDEISESLPTVSSNGCSPAYSGIISSTDENQSSPEKWYAALPPLVTEKSPSLAITGLIKNARKLEEENTDISSHHSYQFSIKTRDQIDKESSNAVTVLIYHDGRWSSNSNLINIDRIQLIPVINGLTVNK